MQPFSFVSWESKTKDGQEVYNRIRFIPGLRFDTWIMQQSHHGTSLPFDLWDRLAIVVDKAQPATARFYQFKPGEIEMAWADEDFPYRAPCFSCHSNGPRAIRPKDANFLQKIKASLLNLRIKTYFQVSSIAGQAESEQAPFKRKHEILNSPLEVESCVACHGDKKIRNGLTLDQASTVKFMVENGQMPPWPFKLKTKDYEDLKEWEL